MSLLTSIKTTVEAFIQPLLSEGMPFLKNPPQDKITPAPSSPLPGLVTQNPHLAQSLGLWPFRGTNLPQHIIDIARQNIGTDYQWGGESKSGMDCSHFVHHVYKQAGISYPYTTTHDNWQRAGFERTEQPKKGDLILWNGHVGIVVDPDKKIFIGAQSSTGVAEASYADNRYWGRQSHTFLTRSNTIQ